MSLQTSKKRPRSVRLSSWFLLWWRHPGVETNAIKFSALPSSSFFFRWHPIGVDRRRRRQQTSIAPLSAHATGDGLIGLTNQTAAGIAVGKAAWVGGGKCLSHRVSNGDLEKIPRNSQSEQQFFFSVSFFFPQPITCCKRWITDTTNPLIPKGHSWASLSHKHALQV